MIPSLHIQRWLSGFRGDRLVALAFAIRTKHNMGHWWENIDTEPMGRR